MSDCGHKKNYLTITKRNKTTKINHGEFYGIIKSSDCVPILNKIMP